MLPGNSGGKQTTRNFVGSEVHESKWIFPKSIAELLLHGDATGFESYMYYRAPKRQDNVYKDDYIKRLDRRVDQLEEQIDTGKLIGQETGRIPDNRQESKIES